MGSTLGFYEIARGVLEGEPRFAETVSREMLLDAVLEKTNKVLPKTKARPNGPEAMHLRCIVSQVLKDAGYQRHSCYASRNPVYRKGVSA